jgi:anti-anti-sigma regulatory factor
MNTAQMTMNPTHFSIPAQASRSTGRDLRSRVNDALGQGDQHLVIDCAEWSQFDLNLLSVLIQCASACRARGASLDVVNVSPHIREEVQSLQLGERLGLAY